MSRYDIMKTTFIYGILGKAFFATLYRDMGTTHGLRSIQGDAAGHFNLGNQTVLFWVTRDQNYEELYHGLAIEFLCYKLLSIESLRLSRPDETRASFSWTSPGALKPKRSQEPHHKMSDGAAQPASKLHSNKLLLSRSRLSCLAPIYSSTRARRYEYALLQSTCTPQSEPSPPKRAGYRASTA